MSRRYIYTFTWLLICFQTPEAWIGVVFTLQADTVCSLWELLGQQSVWLHDNMEGCSALGLPGPAIL